MPMANSSRQIKPALRLGACGFMDGTTEGSPAGATASSAGGRKRLAGGRDRQRLPSGPVQQNKARGGDWDPHGCRPRASILELELSSAGYQKPGTAKLPARERASVLRAQLLTSA